MTTHLGRHYLVPGGEPKAFAAPGKSLLVCRVRLRWRRGHTQGMGKVQGEQRCSKGCQGLVQGKQLPRRAGLPLAFPSRKATCAALQKQGSGTASCQLPTSLKSGQNWVKCTDQCSSKMFTQKTCRGRPLPRASGVDFRAPRNPGCNLVRSKSQSFFIRHPKLITVLGGLSDPCFEAGISSICSRISPADRED